MGDKNIHDDLIFVGYTNGDQILYANDQNKGRGAFYKDTDCDCFIPLYMLKVHQHRIESTSKTGVTLEMIQEVQKESDQ